MANLFNINERIEQLLENEFNENCIDLETGEIDSEKAYKLLGQLIEERKDKIENIVLYIKSLDYDVNAIKEEEKNLKARRESKERKIEWLKNYIKQDLIYNGERKFETPKCALSFIKSQSLEIVNEVEIPKDFIEEVISYKIDKNKIKVAIKNGEKVSGAMIVVNQNLQIK